MPPAGLASDPAAGEAAEGAASPAAPGAHAAGARPPPVGTLSTYSFVDEVTYRFACGGAGVVSVGAGVVWVGVVSVGVVCVGAVSVGVVVCAGAIGSALVWPYAGAAKHTLSAAARRTAHAECVIQKIPSRPRRQAVLPADIPSTWITQERGFGKRCTSVMAPGEGSVGRATGRGRREASPPPATPGGGGRRGRAPHARVAQSGTRRA